MAEMVSKEHLLCLLLKALPSAEVAESARLRRAIHGALADHDLKPSGVECSLAFGEDSFRAMVSLGRDRHQGVDAHRLTRDMGAALGLDFRHVDMVFDWLAYPGHEAYFGIARGKASGWQKIYLRANGGREVDF